MEVEAPVIRFELADYSHPNGVMALRQVSLSIKRGELVAILGSNGAGKSTLARHMNGLLKPTHGKVIIFGADTKETTAASLSRQVGIVFQNPHNQLFAQTVRKELEFALNNFGLDPKQAEARVKWALQKFSLEEYAEKPPMELSGGEKKRLCVALVLAWDPEIIILDEPTVGQDSEQKENLKQTIAFLLSQKKTVVVITHDIEFVWPLQPRTILMSQGRIISDGDSQVVFGDEGSVENASVLSPQLVEFWKLLEIKSRFPKDPAEALRDLKSTHTI